MNYYPQHIGDYAKDTRALTQGEHGAYRLLMDEAYSTEDGVAAEDIYAISCARTAQERKNADRVLAKFFVLVDGRYHQKRIDAEVAKFRAKSDKARNSAGQRWHSEGNANASANAMRTHSEGNATRDSNAYPITNNQKPNPTLLDKPKATGEKHTRAERAKKTAMPPDFGISERVKSWAQQNGFARLPEHLEAFRGACAANGYVYVDWDSAFMNAIRNDWARLRVNGHGPPNRQEALEQRNRVVADSWIPPEMRDGEG